MELKRNGTQRSGKGPAEYFTGAVRIDPLFEQLTRFALLSRGDTLVKLLW